MIQITFFYRLSYSYLLDGNGADKPTDSSKPAASDKENAEKAEEKKKESSLIAHKSAINSYASSILLLVLRRTEDVGFLYKYRYVHACFVMVPNYISCTCGVIQYSNYLPQ